MSNEKIWFGPMLSQLKSWVEKSAPTADRPLAPNTSPDFLLTYPVEDRQGDFVDPDGMETYEFDANPVVNLEHNIPVGRGEIRQMQMKIDGEKWVLPVGKTTFFSSIADTKGLNLNKLDDNGDICGKFTPRECVDISQQACELVRAGVTPGVSIEFRPVPEFMTRRGPSAARTTANKVGHAYTFGKSILTGYAHCAIPVNPGSLALLEKACRVRDLHPMVRKGLNADLLRARELADPAEHKRTKQRLAVSMTPGWYRKTMAPRQQPGYSQDTPGTIPGSEDDQDDAVPNLNTNSLMDGQDDPDTAQQQPGMNSPSPMLQELISYAQAVKDLNSGLMQKLNMTDNPMIKAAVKEMIADEMKKVARILGFVDARHAELNPDAMLMDDQGAQQDIPPADNMQPDATTPPTPDEDDDGNVVTKSFPTFKPRRMPVQNVRRVKRSETTAVPKVDEETLVMKASEVAALLEKAEKYNALQTN